MKLLAKSEESETSKPEQRKDVYSDLAMGKLLKSLKSKIDPGFFCFKNGREWRLEMNEAR